MTASYKFSRFSPFAKKLAEEYMAMYPRRRDMSFERWIQKEKAKNAVAVYQYRLDSTIEIVFKNESDITMFLLTL